MFRVGQRRHAAELGVSEGNAERIICIRVVVVIASGVI